MIVGSGHILRRLLNGMSGMLQYYKIVIRLRMSIDGHVAVLLPCRTGQETVMRKMFTTEIMM
nr:hypothetical protein Iba_chr07cCG4030 [Ipomoea batatas]